MTMLADAVDFVIGVDPYGTTHATSIGELPTTLTAKFWFPIG